MRNSPPRIQHLPVRVEPQAFRKAVVDIGKRTGVEKNQFAAFLQAMAFNLKRWLVLEDSWMRD